MCDSLFVVMVTKHHVITDCMCFKSFLGQWSSAAERNQTLQAVDSCTSRDGTIINIIVYWDKKHSQ